MAMTAYRYYRVNLIRNASGSLATDGTYFAINTLALYEDRAASVLLSQGKPATASGSYSGYPPSGAFDANPTTFWESDNAAVVKWLRVDLGTAKLVRFMRLVSTQYLGEAPKEFQLQGSNDGSSWTTLLDVLDSGANGTKGLTYEAQVGLRVSGTSKLETGSPSTRVQIHKWDTGRLTHSIAPDHTGAYTAVVQESGDVYVVHIGPSGFRPQVDGPITPQEA